MLRLAPLSNRQHTQLSLALLTLVVLALHGLVLVRGDGGLMAQGKGNAAVLSVRMLPAGIPAAASLAEDPPTEAAPADIAADTPTPPAQRNSNGAHAGAAPSGAISGTNSDEMSAEMLDHSVPLAEGFDLDNRPIATARPQGNLNAEVRIPPPTRLMYKVQGQSRGSPTNETADLSWNHDAKTYEARLTSSHPRLGTRIQTSRGLLNTQGLEPGRYGDKAGSERAAHFQRDKGKITFSANSPEAQWHEGMQDPVSVLIQLAALWSAAPGSYPQGASIAIDTVGTRAVEPWVFQVGPIETVSLPAGVVQAWKLVRTPTGPYGSRSEIWLAPALGYLPVRVRTTLANGDTSDRLWSATSQP